MINTAVWNTAVLLDMFSQGASGWAFEELTVFESQKTSLSLMKWINRQNNVFGYRSIVTLKFFSLLLLEYP